MKNVICFRPKGFDLDHNINNYGVKLLGNSFWNEVLKSGVMMSHTSCFNYPLVQLREQKVKEYFKAPPCRSE